VRIIGDLAIDVAAREVRVAGRVVELTKIEFDILQTLTAQPNVVLSRPELIERVWGPNWYGDEHVVDVHLSNLRKKLGDDPKAPRYVVTVRGVGFKLAA
jgi:DNA-binding response OmpR family regulator